MLFIIDYDGTYTANPTVFARLIKDLKENNFEVICCTMRFGIFPHDDDVKKDMAELDVPVVYAGTLGMDKWGAVEASGWNPMGAIWMDDIPQFIWMNRTQEELDSSLKM